MDQKETRATRPYPQSVGNVALAPESLVDPHEGTEVPCSPQLRLLPNVTKAEPKEDEAADPLASATGIMIGLFLALILWGVAAYLLLVTG